MAATLVGIAAAALGGTAAQADKGDGKAACNRAEICFDFAWDDFMTSSFQRHFWYNDADHSNDIWGNVPDGNTSLWVANTAGGLWNRDTECAVTVYDLSSYRTPYTTFPRDFRSPISARNNSHKRCA
ncbi:hypothetical protein ACN26Z_04710 [Verrucosispora sp. WMMD703]|uniref:Peptidase inhibitor family I36 n=2 Tax=Micromonospora sediminimaris TaxID=547162 RepID=A0A9W5UQI6_9ACTN|nr:hypothetical protein [Verrucosispora sp. WMMD1129]WFE45184.1 hypothetical protein O7624_12940 [Verrucosispora sp. WMMD1129]GIJ32486.1 hypothetical protein Vse01_16340 [Micromonospora sediminimaris]